MTTDGNVCSGGGVHAGGGGAGGGAGGGCISGGCGRGHQQLTWEKLSPEEFQQLQDFAACKLLLINDVTILIKTFNENYNDNKLTFFQNF